MNNLILFINNTGNKPWQRKRVSKMKKELIRSVRNATIQACIEAGYSDTASVRKCLKMASESIKPMSLAGVKAAFTKGQEVYIIDKVSQNGYNAFPRS